MSDPVLTRDFFSARPWLQLSQSDLGAATGVPSMLSHEETRFYFWLTRHMARSEGHVVDLGCFAGGSTAYLAEGDRAGGGEARVFAFDRFHVSDKAKEAHLYAKGIAPFEGTNMLPLAKELLAPWPRVAFRKGRIEEQEWREGAISVLVQDASKNAEATARMAEMFFPCLIPGVSILVQQDELHWKEPWAAVLMEQMRDHFEPLCHIPGGMMVYRCVADVTPEALDGGVDVMDDDAMIEALRGAKTRLQDFGVDARLDRQIAGIRANPGKRSAWG
ncbi:MAG: hypothetical protein AAFZ04_15155, partial [Pseudomonadota bacterium]